MSAMPLALLLTTAAATAVGVAALRAVSGCAGRSRPCTPSSPRAVPTAPARRRARRPAPAADTDEIRAAVAEALAEERERELAEARAFWAAQEARDASDAPSLLGSAATANCSCPGRPTSRAWSHLEPVTRARPPRPTEFAEDSPELAAARRRHPSHPDFVPVQSPVVNDHERTVARLEDLAESRTELADVRPGPLGTLDVYVFADGTTLCMTPGHRETAERLAAALRDGDTPVLLGGSGISGAYALTFACGEENVYILADRVIASL